MGKLLDMEVVTSIRELGSFRPDDTFVGDLFELFKQQSERTSKGLVAAATDGDFAQVRSCAHLLKGSAANIGARQMSHQAVAIEATARSSPCDVDALTTAVQGLLDLRRETLAALAVVLLGCRVPMVQSRNPTRCPQCLLLLRLCICALIPRVATKTRLVLLINHREIRQPTNTGGLAARSLVNSEVHVAGAKNQPLDFANVLEPGATNLVLFPTEGAAPLTPEFCAGLRGSLRLIVPDGNWGQAARLQRKLPTGSPTTYVTLRDGQPSQYGLRRPAKDLPAGLATLEAIARALAALEGPEAAAPLLEIFRIFVARTLWSRGKLPADQVYGGIPSV